MKNHLLFLHFIIVMLFCIAACNSNQQLFVDTSSSTQIVNQSNYANAAPTHTTFSLTDTPLITPTPRILEEICSPLEGIFLEEIAQYISQPFKMPPRGTDFGHHGTDFFFYRLGDRIGIQGLPIHSVLDGKVNSILSDHIPYGYTVIIEIPISQLPDEWIIELQPPPIIPTYTPDGRLNCPKIEDDPNLSLEVNQRSLYILYAHLNNPPIVHIGEYVKCGQMIGEVGNSGRSSNPHLHLEMRIGPSGAFFADMAHYDTHATALEMHNYCTWRVSGLFQLIDPMSFLQLKSQ